MDRAKSKLATSKLSNFFDKDDDDTPHTTVDEAKLTQFSAGTVRKSRKEKEQEAAEAKRKEEEESAAKVYAEFLDAFEGEDVGRKSGAAFVPAGSRDSYHRGSRPPPDGPSHARKMRRSPSPATGPKPKGKRAMDAFLEEIKKDQAEREAKYARSGHGRSATAMAAYDGQSGSKDRGDPQTSNIFVANLPPHVTEQNLGNFFAKVGPVGSVKIMWPRSDATAGPGADMSTARRSKNTNLSGFVSFMRRKDAEQALREFDGFDWGGSTLRVGWSKAVPIAAKPMYVSSVAKPFRDSRSRSCSPRRRRYSRHSRSRSDSRSRSRSPRRGHRSHRHSRSRSPRRRRSRSRTRSPSPILDEEDVTDTFIKAVAAEVKGHGEQFEKNLLEKEKDNSKYGFLRRNHRRYGFYRDLVEDDHIQGPEFDDEGYNSIYSTDSAEESERERVQKTILGRLARRRFEAMLRGMSGKKGEIARCMAFSLEHAEAANEVADIIVASLLVDETPVPRKVARLHLICDILHNSAAAVPSAWKFRQEFQARLGIVFDHLANIYHSFPGRITADVFKKQITSVVDIWEDWIVFPPDFTSQLRTRLEGPQTSISVKTIDADADAADDIGVPRSRFNPSTFKATGEEQAPNLTAGGHVDEDVDGTPMDDDIDGTPLNDDIDGVPMDDDIDGAPMEMEDIDGEPLEDVDGMPIADGEDVDGEPMERSDDDQ